MSIEKGIYYNYDKLISYGALLNFVIGERGVGKSYGATKFVINDYLKNGNQFVYLRRYATELDTAVPKFFDAVVYNEEFEGHEFKVRKRNKLSEFVMDGEVIGYAAALSTAGILKSTSFNKVKTIVYDEFIIDKGLHHYLKNEAEVMLDICETIGRMRDIRVIFLGNAISLAANPYFNYFDLELPPLGKEFKTFKDGLIVVNYVKNEAYRAEKKRTKFGRLIEGTDYGRYAIDNEVLRDSNTFLEKRKEDAINWCVVIIKGHSYGVWVGKESNKIYIERNYNPKLPNVFSADEFSHDEKNLLIMAKQSWFRVVVDNFAIGNVRFEDSRVKEDCLTLLRKIYM